MAFINGHIRGLLREQRVEVFFVSGATTKWWNAKRTDKKTEIALLSGWYWALGRDEAGPFRSPSAAWRDCYYRQLLQQAPPCLNQRDVAQIGREIQREAAAETRRQGRAKQSKAARLETTHARR